MKTAKEKINLLETLDTLLRQYESQEISPAYAQPKLTALIEALRVCDQTEFDSEIRAWQPTVEKVMARFDSKQYSTADLKPMTFVTIQTLERMAGLFEYCRSMVFVLPPIGAFLLGILHFSLALVKLNVQNKDPETAELILRMLCVCILPFYQSNIFTVLPKKSGKSNSELHPCQLDLRKITEMALLNHAVMLCDEKKYDKARTALLSCESWHAKIQPKDTIIQVQINCIYNQQQSKAKKLFKSNRDLWKKSFKDIRFITEKLKPQALSTTRYYLWGKLTLEDTTPDLTLSSNYFDLCATHYLQMRNNTPPDRLIMELKTLASRFESVNNFSSAMRCYRTALKLYSGYALLLGEYREEKNQLEKQLFKLKTTAFLHLKQAWQDLAVESLDHVLTVDFEEKHHWCQIKYTDRAYMLCHARFLNELGAENQVQRELCMITLNTPDELSAKSLLHTFLQAKHRFQKSQYKPQQLSSLQPKRAVEKDKSESSTEESISPFEISSTYQIAYHIARKAPKHPKSKSPPPQKTNTAKTISTLSWGDDYPLYHPTKGIVYPIPNPLVKNSSMPKGIFYAYVDRQQLPELPDEMLEQFEIQLARGKIVSKGDAHGIRSIKGELVEDSPYVFKINIHAEDIRLYGRKVATALSKEGVATVLIAFDQAIRHDEQLIMQPKATTSLKLPQ